MSLKVPRWLQFKERITGDTDVGSTIDEGIANRPLRDLYDNQVSINNGLDGHINNKSNPHGTNKTHVGLSNVSNFTATDATNDSSTVKYALANGVKKAYDKAVAVLTDLTSHKNNKSNPHGVTCDQIQAVKRSGDTMTGNLLFPDLSKGLGFAQTPGAPTSDGAYICIESLTDLGNNELVITKTDGNGGSPDDGILFNWKAKDGANINQGKYLRLHASKIEFGHKNIYTTDNQRLYHQGFKPTKADVGLSQVNNWPATSAVNDSSSSKYATALGVKTAYDKAVASQGTANNAVMKAGDTMTGALNIAMSGSSARLVVDRTDSNDNINMAFKGQNDTPIYFGIRSDGHFYYRTNNQDLAGGYKIYSTGHKPTKADVGLGSVNNWPATAATNDSSDVKYATAGAVKKAHDLASGKVSKAGDTMTGNLTINPNLTVNGASILGSVHGRLITGSNKQILNHSADTVYLGNPTNVNLRLETSPSGTLMHNTYKVFTDNYHPNADRWTTARTLTLGGDLTGSASIDGGSNITLNATVKDGSHHHDTQYIKRTGDIVTGKFIFNGSDSQLFVARQHHGTSEPIIDLAVGDRDTGLNWVSDGVLDVYTDGVPMMTFNKLISVDVKKKLNVAQETTCTGKVTVNNDLAIKQGTIRYNTEEQSMEFIV